MRIYDKKLNEIDCIKWHEFMRDDYRIVKVNEMDHFSISTVWLGLDHNLFKSGPPKIFETAIFYNNGLVDIIGRYTTESDALEGHNKALEWFSIE